MYEQFAHVAVSSLADTEKPLLSAGRVFSRHNAEPRGQIAGFLELPTVSNGSKECSRAQWLRRRRPCRGCNRPQARLRDLVD